MRALQWLACITAVLLRLWLSRNYRAALQDRVELASPLTSYRRRKLRRIGAYLTIALVEEGLFLENQQRSQFHQQQAHLLPPYVINLFFVLIDLISAWFIFLIVRRIISSEAAQNHSVERTSITLSKYSAMQRNELRLRLCNPSPTLYLLHPYGWLSSAAFSLTMLENLFVLGALYFAMRDNHILAPFCVVAAAYMGLYPIMLMVPVALILKQNRLNGILLFFFWAYAFGLGSYLITGPEKWRWLRSTYWFNLTVQDLTPNIGLFWYYFLETFTHYRNFFLVALQMHTFSYVIPCALRLRKHPVLMFWVFVSITTLFKPYPVVGDVLLQLSLLPIFYKLLYYVKASFILLNVHIYTSLLFPVLWYMWVESGSGNANFVYAITLVHALADGWLVAEVVSCALAWDYSDRHKVSMHPKKAPSTAATETPSESKIKNE